MPLLWIGNSHRHKILAKQLHGKDNKYRPINNKIQSLNKYTQCIFINTYVIVIKNSNCGFITQLTLYQWEHINKQKTNIYTGL